MYLKRVNNKGFTLVELLVIIAIITLLSSIVFVGLQGFKAKARDSRRISDLNQIRTALSLYYITYGNWIIGCGGAGGGGQGWFNYVGGIYPKSIAQCLIEAGFLSSEIIDPTGGTTSTSTSRYAYMKYHCGTPSIAYIYAKLETKSPYTATEVNETCCATCGSSYGMNYYLKVQ